MHVSDVQGTGVQSVDNAATLAVLDTPSNRGAALVQALARVCEFAGQGKSEVYGARVYARNASVVDRG